MYRIPIMSFSIGLIVICNIIAVVITSNEVDKKGCNYRCRHIRTRRVCGSDGFIYRNYCELKKSACLDDFQLKKVPDSWCKLSLELHDDYHSDKDDGGSNSSEGCESSSSSEEGCGGKLPDNPGRVTLIPSTLATTTKHLQTTSPIARTTHPVPARRTTTQMLTTQTVPTTQVPTVPRLLTTLLATTRVLTTQAATTTPKVCPSVCPLVLEPVCGTNGMTYTSVCVLQAEACINDDPTLTVDYDGPCITTLNPLEPQK